MLCLFILALVFSTPPNSQRESWKVPDSYHSVIIRKRFRYFKPKLIALTFDDGPSANNTPRILQSLQQHHAHATFFILGNQAKLHPELVKQIADEGHAIGIHTFTHSRLPTATQAEDELSKCELLLKTITGKSTQLFRPPYGNTHSNYTESALKRGYAVVIWSVSSADTATHDQKMVLDNVTLGVEPGDIVLMHDSSDKGHTADALPKILDRLSKKGFQVVTIPELLEAWDQKNTTVPKPRGVF